jgi:hypothetical protein
LIGGYTYQYKLNQKEIEKQQSPEESSGVIAQELEKIIPAAVKTGDDDYKSVNYNVIIGYLIEAVKELQEEVNTLKGQ